jgi:LuxR family maltose regulon positive regulatory protein
MTYPPINPSKLRPPALPPVTIARPSLMQLLQSSAERGCLLSLVSAPLGYGKSTLLAQYAASLQAPWAWLRCDASDNQPLSLLAHLSQALQLPVPARALTPGDAPQLWAALLTHLEQRRDGLTLILDDLHLLRAPSACRYLDELLRFAPAGLRLLAASRGLPRLAFSHLRRDQRLLLLEAGDLALDSAEIGELANARGLDLDSDVIYQLRASSEGWISGVLFGLAAFADQARPGLRAIGRQTSTQVARFLDEELLRGLPPALLGFLERTSVVSAFDVELAARLSGQGDAAQMIRHLLRADLFLQQCADEHLSYRYHPALRRTCYQRIRQRDPQALLRLHRQAADWLLEQRRYSEAIYQLGRAHDYNALFAAVERHSFDLLREGKVDAIVDFLADLPGAAGDHLSLAITEASTVIATNDVQRACNCLLRLQRLLRQQQQPQHRPERVYQTLAFLRSRLAVLGGNLSHGVQLVGNALQRYPQPTAASAVLLFNRASCHFALGRLGDARDDAEQALGELEALGFRGYTNSLHLLLGQIELARGQTEAAARRFRGLDQGSPSNAPRSFYAVYQHLGMGLALLQQNRLEQAGQCFDQAEAIALDVVHCAALPWVLHCKAGLLAARGERAQARAAWDETRRLARQYQLFALYRLAGAWRARLAVGEHDQDFILLWLEEWHWCRRHYGVELQPEEWLAYAWVQRHLGQHASAASIAANLQELARSEGNHLLQVDLHLLQASLNQGSPEARRESLEQALQLAIHHGFGQLLHHEGRALGEALRALVDPQLRRQQGLPPLLPRDQLQPLLRELFASAGKPQALPEALTRREQDVLRRMASGQGNQQIADGLFISLSTVKTHINNLFRKLDASDRDTALQVARAARLLD